jgi:hypothetical protein
MTWASIGDMACVECVEDRRGSVSCHGCRAVVVVACKSLLVCRPLRRVGTGREGGRFLARWNPPQGSSQPHSAATWLPQRVGSGLSSGSVSGRGPVRRARGCRQPSPAHAQLISARLGLSDALAPCWPRWLCLRADFKPELCAGRRRMDEVCLSALFSLDAMQHGLGRPNPRQGGSSFWGRTTARAVLRCLGRATRRRNRMRATDCMSPLACAGLTCVSCFTAGCLFDTFFFRWMAIPALLF